MHRNDYTFDEKLPKFIHIPKSGGTSFNNVIKELSLNVEHNPRLHQPVSEKCPPETFKYIISLRNPINRVWSYYNMVLRGGPKYPYYNFTQSFEKFLNNCWEVNNQATLYLAGAINKKKKINGYLRITPAIYEKALKNLRCMHHIIIFEEFEDGVTKYLNNSGVSSNSYKIPHARKAEYNKNIPQDIIQKIIKHNEYDIKLYNEALKITQNQN